MKIVEKIIGSSDPSIFSTEGLSEADAHYVNFWKSLEDQSVDQLFNQLATTVDEDEKLLVITSIIDKVDDDATTDQNLRDQMKPYHDLLHEVYKMCSKR